MLAVLPSVPHDSFFERVSHPRRAHALVPVPFLQEIPARPFANKLQRYEGMIPGLGAYNPLCKLFLLFLDLDLLLFLLYKVFRRVGI